MDIIVLKRMPIEKESVEFKEILCFRKGRLFKYREPLFEGNVVDIGAKYNSPSFWNKYRKTGYYQQMREASLRLYQQCLKSPEIAAKYTQEQLDAMAKGCKKIPGYTWHHLRRKFPFFWKYEMVLVDENIHKKNLHYGGSAMNNSNWVKEKLIQKNAWNISFARQIYNTIYFVSTQYWLTMLLLFLLILLACNFGFSHDTKTVNEVFFEKEDIMPSIEKDTCKNEVIHQCFYFPFDKFVSIEEKHIKQICDSLNTQKRNVRKVLVKGFSCELGDSTYNVLLSEKRAKYVKCIIQENIPSLSEDSISIMGLGFNRKDLNQIKSNKLCRKADVFFWLQ